MWSKMSSNQPSVTLNKFYLSGILRFSCSLDFQQRSNEQQANHPKLLVNGQAFLKLEALPNPSATASLLSFEVSTKSHFFCISLDALQFPFYSCVCVLMHFQRVTFDVRKILVLI